MTEAQWQKPEVPHPTGVGRFRFFRPIHQEADRKKTGSRDHCCNALFDNAIAGNRSRKQQVNWKETGRLPCEAAFLHSNEEPEAIGHLSVVWTMNTRSDRCRAYAPRTVRLPAKFSVSSPRTHLGVRTRLPAFECASPATSGRTNHPRIRALRCLPEVEL